MTDEPDARNLEQSPRDLERRLGRLRYSAKHFRLLVETMAEGMAMMGAASVLYPQLRLEDVVLANTVVLIMGFFASLSPAWRASRFQPIEAITKVN